MSGIKAHPDDLLRFLTLTSGDDSYALSRHFRDLVEIIRNTTPLDLWSDGYVHWHDMRKFYRGKNLLAPLRFDYCRTRTSEGNGVLHTPYFGDYLPQAWLSKLWNDIHGAWLVDIRACKGKTYDERRLVHYIITQYVAGQSALEHSSTSGGWLFRGFRTYFKRLVKRYGYYAALARWDVILRSGRDPRTLGQQTLGGPPLSDV